MNGQWEVFRPGGPKKPNLGNIKRWPWAWIIPGIFIFLLIWSSFYTIEADSVGLILRFGKYVRSTGPGPHLKLPFGIESVLKVQVEKSLKQEFGFRTLSIGQRTQYVPAEDTEEPVMLTGDLSIVNVEWVVLYRILDPEAYYFKISDPVKTLRDISQAAMRQVVGDRTVDEVLTYGREKIAYDVAQLMSELMKFYHTGIIIEKVVLENVQPPENVKPAFNEVNQAKQQQEQLINEAWEAYNKEIPQAQGEAQQTIADAEGFALEVVNKARGDAQRFLSILSEYRKAPQVTRYRIYLETMHEILPKIQNVYIVDEQIKQMIPMLNFAGGVAPPGAQEK